MNKSEISMKKIGKYLREISVVVIGVAITLSASYWITNRNENRDMALYLNAIKLELENNAASFDGYAKELHKSVEYANYVQTHDEKSINQDTIDYYMSSSDGGIGWGMIQSSIIYSKNAFEMFKVSGAMRQMVDKELLMSICGTYSKMENVQLLLDLCYQRKGEEAMREWYLRADGKQITVPMKIFYGGDLPSAMIRNCEMAAGMIREALSKLEESKYK